VVASSPEDLTPCKLGPYPLHRRPFHSRGLIRRRSVRASDAVTQKRPRAHHANLSSWPTRGGGEARARVTRHSSARRVHRVDTRSSPSSLTRAPTLARSSLSVLTNPRPRVTPLAVRTSPSARCPSPASSTGSSRPRRAWRSEGRRETGVTVRSYWSRHASYGNLRLSAPHLNSKPLTLAPKP